MRDRVMPTARFLILTAMALLLLGGCGTWDFMYPEDAAGQELTYYTFDLINWVTVIGFVPVIAIMIWFAIKYRKKTPDQKALSQVAHSTPLEIAWSIPPFILVMVIFYMGLLGFDNLRTIPDGYTIEVEASQFDWKFTHPNGRPYSGPESMGALEIPAGEDIVLRISSADTIHSVHIPDFAVKIDAIRGRYTYVWIPAIDYEKYKNPWADKEPPTERAALEADARKGVERLMIIAVHNKHKRREAIPFYSNWDKIIVPAFEALDASMKQEVEKAIDDGMTVVEKASDGSSKERFIPGMKSVFKDALAGFEEKDLNDKAKVEAAEMKALRAKAEEYYRYMAMGEGHTFYCTEMCGVGHSQMIRRVVVHKPGWTPPPVSYRSKGHELFMTKGCSGCHFATNGLYPYFKKNLWGNTETLTDNSTIKLLGTDAKDRESPQFKAARDYLIESIMLPNKRIVKGFQPIMPAAMVTRSEAETIVDEYLIGDPEVKFEGK